MLRVAPRDVVSIIKIIPTIVRKVFKERLDTNDDGTTRPLQKILTSLRLPRSLVQIKRKKEVSVATRAIERDAAEHLADIERLRATLHTLHREVRDHADPCGQRLIDAQNK